MKAQLRKVSRKCPDRHPSSPETALPALKTASAIRRPAVEDEDSAVYGDAADPNVRLIQRLHVLRGLQRDGTIMVTSSHWEHVKERALAAGADPVLAASLGLTEPQTEQDKAAERLLLARFGWRAPAEGNSATCASEPLGQRSANCCVPRKAGSP